MRSSCKQLLVLPLEVSTYAETQHQQLVSPWYALANSATYVGWVTKDWRCRAQVTPASSHASPCWGEALTSPAIHACGSASPIRARCCHRNRYQCKNCPLLLSVRPVCVSNRRWSRMAFLATTLWKRARLCWVIKVFVALMNSTRWVRNTRYALARVRFGCCHQQLARIVLALLLASSAGDAGSSE